MSSVTPKQIAKTINLIADSEIESAQYQALLGSGRFTVLLREFMGQVEPSVTTYKVTVDYRQPLADMIDAGKYDWVNSDITQEHFPHEPCDTEEVALQVVHFGHEMTTKEVLAELDKRGLRPATLPELLALGTAHPNLQREIPIVALGSGWRYPLGSVRVPILSESDDERDLNLDWLGPGFRWGGYCRFVAVSK